MSILNNRSISRLRTILQWGFLVWVAGIGIRFGIFIDSMERGQNNPFFSHPPGVEGFLPIGALTSLKYWFVTGEINMVHPAALVIFIAVVLMSLFAKKSFCSWLCPVGTISESAFKIGARLFGRNFQIWKWLDIILRGIKYFLLFFFIKVILIDMPASGIVAFMNAPYWAISDVKMLYFFTRMSQTTFIVLLVITFLSLLYRNFWCRYLCPYGALLGLASLISPFRIQRNPDGCTGCQTCTSLCPAHLPVHARKTIYSPECTGCLTCVTNCPEKDVLAMKLSFWKQPLPVWVYPAVLSLVFITCIAVGIFSGHWHSSLGYSDYQTLLPLVPYLSH